MGRRLGMNDPADWPALEAAINKAFDAYVECLFDVMVSGMITGLEADARRRFASGLEKAIEAKRLAMSVVDERAKQ
jgi:hypothetical protein